MTNAPSDSRSEIMGAIFAWSNARFSSFINLDANSVKYWLRLSGFWLMHFLVDRVYGELSPILLLPSAGMKVSSM